MAQGEVLRFWRLIEALSPQEAEKPKPADQDSPSYDVSDGILPWEAGHYHRKRVLSLETWRYSAWCCVHEIREISDRLARRIGVAEDEGFDERLRAGKTRAFDLAFDERGLPIPESLVLSLGFWLAGQILAFGAQALGEGFAGRLDPKGLPDGVKINLRPSGYPSFDELTSRLVAYLVHQRARLEQEQRAASFVWLVEFCRLVAKKCYLPEFAESPSIWIKCAKVRRLTLPQSEGAKPDLGVEAAADDRLNSFFVTDLSLVRAAWKAGNVGPALKSYLGLTRPAERIDVRTPEGLRFASQALMPQRMPAGCWPSDHPLVFSQQLAVNEIWHRLAAGAGLFSVNGPPGTGKTTLLRDLVAAVVVERAQNLALRLRQGQRVFGASCCFEIERKKRIYYPLPEAIAGTAIVVVSANNGAVENVTLELPLAENVPERVQIDFYRGLAEKILGKPAWGLISAPLGRKTNREKFLDAFWWSEPKAEAAPEEIAQAGMRWRLGAIETRRLAPHLALTEALERFEQALAEERHLRSEHMRCAELLQRFEAVRAELARIERELTTEPPAECARRLENARFRLDEIERDLNRHTAAKPGVLEILFTMGKAVRAWRQRYERLQDQLAAARAALEKATQDAARLERVQHRQQGLRVELEAMTRELRAAATRLGPHWPRPEAADDERERSSPWMDAEWRRAHERLFLAALDLHRAFIERYASQMRANLGAAAYWLEGKKLPEEVARTALDSLALVVPVISTTFASVASMFRDLGRESIGWLLIDEAGQAAPQLAAGAIWRSRRVVVVGDPLQLEPIVTVPPHVEQALARSCGVDRLWWPSTTSVQVLADAGNNVGTWLPADGDQKTWVGCPLRVHRRCAEPMFTISNQIAYDGLMIHGNPNARGLAIWYHIESTESEGHWIPTEGEELRKVVKALLTEGFSPEEVFLLSPFRDCANKLRELAPQLGLDRKLCGTVHTAQGKQARAVILVLGGDPKRPGSKDWAAFKPNLLNVAVTRAKERFIVIGNRTEWKRRRFFNELDRRIG